MNAAIKVPPCVPDFSSSGGSNQSDLLAWIETHLTGSGDIFQSNVYGARVYVITDPRHVEHVLRRNWQNYRRGRAIKRFRMLLGNGLVVSEGELWKRQRRMIQPAFQEKGIERLTGLIQNRNAKLLAQWTDAARNARSINVTRDISIAILDIILEIIFGDDYGEVAAHFSLLSDEQERTLQFAQQFRALGQLVKDVITKRRLEQREAPDLLGFMLQARDRDTGKGMPDRQVVDEVLTLLVAGHETTASTLNWAWYLVSRNHAVAERMYAEVSAVSDLHRMTYTRWIIEETMRLYPALWLFTRQAIDDDMLGDYHVPAKTEIFICPYAIQRRPNLWPDPERFDPTRFDPARANERHPLAFVPFSAGPRNCIGEHLARWEMLIHMSMIGKQLRLRYIGDDPEYDVGINLRTKQDLIMQVESA